MSIASDPAPGAVWQVWYRDTFDRECSPGVEAEGVGLAQGLAELWARHLFETVREDGKRGFSRFHLWWQQKGESVRIPDDPAGVLRLRQWIFGAQRHTTRGYLAAADRRLLEKVALAHARLLVAGQTAQPIMAAARAAADQQDLEQHILRLF
jgi:hypothetical protein